ncbi:hypothetical protein [Pedobacter sp. GR22-6]|uniref:hypothetical protein n=1 Tax=Pedobacter sp. GR22-6 TaxID=3127957 RepID=UPI00307D960A
MESSNQNIQPSVPSSIGQYLDFADYLSKIVPALGLIALLYGNLRAFFFYLMFSVNIYDFIDLEEILKLAIKDLLPAGLILGMILLMRATTKWFGLTAFIIGLASIIFSYYLIFNSESPLASATAEWISLGIVLVIFVIFFIKFYKENVKAAIIAGLFSIVLLPFLSSNVLATLILNTEIYDGKSITLNDGKTITSDRKQKFIGKTGDYFFFFNIDQRNTTAYCMDDVSYLNIGFTF